MEGCFQVLQNITDDEINIMRHNACRMVREKLSLRIVANNVLSLSYLINFDYVDV